MGGDCLSAVDALCIDEMKLCRLRGRMGVRGSNWASPMLRRSSHLQRNSVLPVSSCASLKLLDPCIWLSYTGSCGLRRPMLLLQEMRQASVVGGCPRMHLTPRIQNLRWFSCHFSLSAQPAWFNADASLDRPVGLQVLICALEALAQLVLLDLQRRGDPTSNIGCVVARQFCDNMGVVGASAKGLHKGAIGLHFTGLGFLLRGSLHKFPRVSHGRRAEYLGGCAFTGPRLQPCLLGATNGESGPTGKDLWPLGDQMCCPADAVAVSWV